MKQVFKNIFNFVKKVFNEWVADKAPKLGASLAYYTVFSIAPLLLIAISIAGLIFGREAAQGEIVTQIEEFIGRDGATLVQTALKNTSDTESGIIALAISFATLVIGSTTCFIELQDSLNMIWKVRPKSDRSFIRAFLVDRVQSFALVIATGFLLLVSLIISTGLSAFNTFLGQKFVAIPFHLLELINNLFSLGVVFILFSLIYKVLPDVQIKLKDVWLGALVTAILFVIGKFLIGLYLGSNSMSSTWGAAGSFVILLVWVYYSAQILFLGAEFTHIYARDHGSGVIPKSKFERYFLETGSSKKKELNQAQK